MTVKEALENTIKQLEYMKLLDCEASSVTLDNQTILEPVDGIIPGAQLNRIKGYAFALNFCVMDREYFA